MIDTAVPINEKASYYFSPKHRRIATEDVSIWDIDFQNELSCFKASIHNEWIYNEVSWGFIKNGEEFIIVGHNLINRELKFAKFVSNENIWHGYPADFRNKPDDKPVPQLLLIWFNEKVISKPLLKRIKQGQI